MCIRDSDQAAAQGNTQAQAAPPATPPTGDTTEATGEKKWSDLDGNGNGTLSASEAQQVPSLSKIFAEADANADGELSQDEYKAWVASNNATRGQPASDS